MDTAEILQVQHDVREDWVVLRLAGELDIAGLPAIRRTVSEICADHPRPDVVADLSAVTFMDSCGLNGLIKAWRQIAAQGGRFAVAGVQPRVARVFELTGMDRAFEMHDRPEDLASR